MILLKGVILLTGGKRKIYFEPNGKYYTCIPIFSMPDKRMPDTGLTTQKYSTYFD